jgi:predicted peptidase
MLRHILLSVLVCVFLTVTSRAQNEASPGKQVELRMSDTTGDMEFLMYLPQKYDGDKDKTWPLVLFLHGRGESNGPLSLVAKWGPPRFAQRGDDLPFILVSPQCPRDGRWSDETRQKQLDMLLKSLSKSHRVDQKRIYLTGLSMGGYGSWTLAANHPDRFAAVVPVCGGGDPMEADKLKSLPIWVFHGDQDRAVPFSRSVEMVKAIQEAGSTDIRFTTMEHVGHNCWSSAYALPELYNWMLHQKLE